MQSHPSTQGCSCISVEYWVTTSSSCYPTSTRRTLTCNLSRTGFLLSLQKIRWLLLSIGKHKPPYYIYRDSTTIGESPFFDGLQKQVLSQSFLQAFTDGGDETSRVNCLRLYAFHQVDEVLGSDAVIQGIEASSLQLVAEVLQSLDAI